MTRNIAKKFFDNMKKPPKWQQEKIDLMKTLDRKFEKMIELLEEIHTDIHELKEKKVNIYYKYPPMPTNPLAIPKVEVI